METRKKIAETLKARLKDVVERGRVLSQALKVRADIAATRRRLRTAFAQLGEEVYTRMKAGQLAALDQDSKLVSMQERIDGLKAEMRLQEAELRAILQAGMKSSQKEEE